jgi:hypothetical protein
MGIAGGHFIAETEEKSSLVARQHKSWSWVGGEGDRTTGARIQ